jgi:replicative DNA helicase
MEEVLNTSWESEVSILGMIILNNDLFFNLDLTEDDFAYVEHKNIFKHIKH